MVGVKGELPKADGYSNSDWYFSSIDVTCTMYNPDQLKSDDKTRMRLGVGWGDSEIHRSDRKQLIIK